MLDLFKENSSDSPGVIKYNQLKLLLEIENISNAFKLISITEKNQSSTNVDVNKAVSIVNYLSSLIRIPKIELIKAIIENKHDNQIRLLIEGQEVIDKQNFQSNDIEYDKKVNYNNMSPHELALTANKKAIPFIRSFLINGNLNEKRLAASALGKLASTFFDECNDLIPDLLKVVEKHPHTQTCQYTLKTLLKLDLQHSNLEIIHHTFKHDKKPYNKQLSETILAKFNAEEGSPLEYLALAISNIIITYRHGEIPPLDKHHVLKWALQFPEQQQKVILKEIYYIVKNSYFSKSKIFSFIKTLISTPELVTNDPISFWDNAHLLNIQKGGNSQKDFNEIIYEAVNKSFGILIRNNNPICENYIYIDDIIFSGNRARNDLESWIENNAPPKCVVNIVVIAYYLGGHYYCSQRLEKKAKQCKKVIDFVWWRETELENRKNNYNYSDVLSPCYFPDDSDVQDYLVFLENSGYPAQERMVHQEPYSSPCFSDEEGRQALERAFLIAGVKIRKECPYLPEKMRPLGYSYLSTLGFGSTIITYRNCPNTTPLAFWVGHPWYPLFPRKIN